MLSYSYFPIRRLFVVVVLSALVAVGCGGGGGRLSRSSFSGSWPWGASSVTVGCDRVFAGPMLWVEIGSTRYALNGLAAERSAGRQLDASTPSSVWLQSPSNPGARVPIGDMVTAAAARC